MEDPYFRGYTRDPPPHHHNPQAFHERTTSFFIAVPFIVCFSLFGVFNLVGGTVLTVMSCKPKLTPKALASLQRLVRNFRLDAHHIDPMRVVGIMLLVTGSLLVLIGLALGVTACRSVSEHERKRRRQLTSSSGMLPMYSLADRRRTSASSSSPSSFAASGRGRSNGKKRSLEKTVSPILEASGEYESLECERLAVEIHHVSNSSVRDISPSVSVEVVCHASMPKEDVRHIDSPTDDVACHAGASTDVCHADLSTDAICHAGSSTDAICQTGLKAETICQTGLLTVDNCQTGMLTQNRCETNVSTEDNCQADLSIEAVCSEGVTTDSGEDGLSTNAIQHEDLLRESSCHTRLPVASLSRNRFSCDSDRILPWDSSEQVEITVVDVQHEMVNFTTADDTGPLVRDH